MLDLIDDALEAFFRAAVPLDARDVDVSFEPPERDWSAKLTRPTVNIFLWDIRRSNERARAGREEIERNGQLVRRLPPPRVELRYLVTAWTADHGDERALLSGLMRATLAHAELPAAFVPVPLRSELPLPLTMAGSTDERADVSKILDGQLKPGITLAIVASVDIDVYTPAGPPVEVYELRLAGDDRSAVVRRVAGEVADPAAVGATVVTPRGVATVNPAGRFVVAAAAGDEVVIETHPPRTAVVPPQGGVRVP